MILLTLSVLWYFALSPFFDPESANGELIAQYKGKMPEENELLGSKEGWHHQLRMRRGLQYVVLHDPFDTKAQVDGPNGKEQSNVWIVRKQHRDEPNDDNVKVLGFYFIANDAIFEAPSMASILSTRLVCMTR
jgi:mediator of RNA polymerase II transcription subunit 6